MKHVTNHQLFDYWMRRRGQRAIPMRSEIEPSDIHKILPDTFVLQCDDPGNHGFRIAGSRICAFYGIELKGTGFLTLWQGTDSKVVRNAIASIRETGHCALIGWRATAQTGDQVDGETLILPLGTDRQEVNRLLGTLVPMTSPYWVGMLPVQELNLQSLRMIDPSKEHHRHFSAKQDNHPGVFARAPRPVLRQGHLSLYLGGRDSDAGNNR